MELIVEEKRTKDESIYLSDTSFKWRQEVA
jgi:hypothetical protein